MLKIKLSATQHANTSHVKFEKAFKHKPTKQYYQLVNNLLANNHSLYTAMVTASAKLTRLQRASVNRNLKAHNITVIVGCI